jgi:hypothetical protein
MFVCLYVFVLHWLVLHVIMDDLFVLSVEWITQHCLKCVLRRLKFFFAISESTRVFEMAEL